MINAPATHERVREKYESVAALCRALGFSTRNYYYTVNGLQGRRRGSASTILLQLLRDEQLLVETQGEDGNDGP